MAYKLELKGYVHLEVLSSTLQRWSSAQPDVFIISQEGHKIYAQSSILSFYSPLLMEILATNCRSVGISLEASSKSIKSLLNVLTSGMAFTKEQGNLMEAIRTAEFLGISIKNWKIVKRKDNGRETKSSMDAIPLNENENRNNEKLLKSKIIHGTVTKLDKRCWRCDTCGHEIIDSKNIQRHIETHSNAGSSDNPTIKNEDNGTEQDSETPSCYESSNNNQQIPLAVDENIKEKESVADESEETHYLNEAGEYVCLKCGSVIKNRKGFIRHWNTHSGVKFRCKYCGSDFARKDTLQLHIQKKHTGGGVKPNYEKSTTDEEN